MWRTSRVTGPKILLRPERVAHPAIGRRVPAERPKSQHAQHHVDSAALDRDLRQALAAEVLPEFIEIEFEQVMAVVFAT